MTNMIIRKDQHEGLSFRDARNALWSIGLSPVEHWAFPCGALGFPSWGVGRCPTGHFPPPAIAPSPSSSSAFPCVVSCSRARAYVLYIMYNEQKSLPLPKKCCVCFAGCENCRTFASANEPDRPLGTGRALMRSLQGARSLRDLHRQRL